MFAVPPFARRVTLIGCDPSATPNLTVGYVRFWQSPDGQTGGNSVGNVFISANQPGPFPVPNAGQYFSVFNQSGVAMKMAAIFELAI